MSLSGLISPRAADPKSESSRTRYRPQRSASLFSSTCVSPSFSIRPTCCLYYDRLLLHPVVGRFLRDDDVVHVALAQAGGRDAQEARLGLQLGDAAGAAVPHAGAQAADHLIDQLGERPFGGHAAFDAFGNHFDVGILGIAVVAGRSEERRGGKEGRYLRA